MPQSNCVNSEAIKPAAWGRAMWRFLFAVSLQKDSLPLRFDVLVRAVVRGIPCENCRSHAMQHIRNRRPPLSTATGEAFAYVLLFQNGVNGRQGKHDISIEEALRRYGNVNVRTAAMNLARKLETACPRECAGRAQDIEIFAGNASMRTRSANDALAALSNFI